MPSILAAQYTSCPELQHGPGKGDHLQSRRPPSAIKATKTGVRARARLDSIQRIISSTRKLFVEVGYDLTTLQRIADDSHLAVGTLFHYISDKRDLLYLIFNEEFDKVTTAGLRAHRPTQSFRDKILSLTAPYYRLAARNPELFRILLSESQQHTPGFHLPRFLEIRARLIHGLEELAVDAQKRGEIANRDDPNDVALSIFFCFSAAARWWIATDKPKWREGHKSFERILNILVTGIALVPGPAAHPSYDAAGRSELKPSTAARKVTQRERPISRKNRSTET